MSIIFVVFFFCFPVYTYTTTTMDLDDDTHPQPSAYTLQTIPFGKLMHFMRREDLATALGPATYKAIENEATAAGENFTSRFLKNYVANDVAMIEHLRGTELGQQAFDKYMANYRRITDPGALARGREVRKAMAGPRKGYLGCIATKVKPDDIRDCVDNFDNESYQSLELVPSAALRESAFRKTGNMALRSNAHISDLPRGLKQYIDSHPDEYEDYLDERKAEVEFLKSVRRNARHEWRKKHAKKENGEGSVSGEQSSKRRRDEDAESNW